MTGESVNARPEGAAAAAPGVPAAPAAGAVRSYRGADFTVAELLAAKGATRVSVVIPAKDEAATVGDIVARVREEWLVRQPLVDEVIVMDSDSTDDTATIAARAGATVFAAADIRPELGRARGKGEALWKSLHVATGDVLVFLDADLIEWDVAFVTGLLGPLLTDPSIALVKAVYHRPLLDPEGHEAEQGGRVTELVARPLLALHWPQLAGLVQPLAGEWAIRRSVAASAPMPVGYGVEIAALIDTANRWGAGAIGQVELGRRAHRHHRHDTLGPMAVQVMAAAERRLPHTQSLQQADLATLRQYDRVDGHFVARDTEVHIWERPPADSVASVEGEDS